LFKQKIRPVFVFADMKPYKISDIKY